MPPGEVWDRLAALYARVATTVADAARDKARPVVMSGDCMTSLATITGLQAAGLDPAIVWLDAHGDVQTLETTASGYLGGMPLRLLTAALRLLLSSGRVAAIGIACTWYPGHNAAEHVGSYLNDALAPER